MTVRARMPYGIGHLDLVLTPTWLLYAVVHVAAATILWLVGAAGADMAAAFLANDVDGL
jgi:hypothetical protein